MTEYDEDSGALPIEKSITGVFNPYRKATTAENYQTAAEVEETYSAARNA